MTGERAIGHMKGRFRRLTYITIHNASKHYYLALTIMSDCILHNLCILNHEDIEDYVVPDQDDNNHPNLFINFILIILMVCNVGCCHMVDLGYLWFLLLFCNKNT